MTINDDSWCVCGHHKIEHNTMDNSCAQCDCKKFALPKKTDNSVWCAGCGKRLPDPTHSEDIFEEHGCFYFVHLYVNHRRDGQENNQPVTIEEQIIARLDHPSFCSDCARRLTQTKWDENGTTTKWQFFPCGCGG